MLNGAAGDRLARILPHAKTIVLPRSGHAPLLERNFSLLRLLIRTRVLPPSPFTTDSTRSEYEQEASVVASSDETASKSAALAIAQNVSQRVTVPPDV